MSACQPAPCGLHPKSGNVLKDSGSQSEVKGEVSVDGVKDRHGPLGRDTSLPARPKHTPSTVTSSKGPRHTPGAFL